MLDVIVDTEIAGVRERAQQGNLDSITYLATCIQKGLHTAKNLQLALSLFNYVIERKKDIVHKETYWNALCQKTHILSEIGQEDKMDAIALEIIRDMVQYPPEEWDYGRLQSAVQMLAENHSA